VGNLAVGGTGKTPTTASIVAALRLGGKRVGVVMAGYRAKGWTHAEGVLVSDGAALLAGVDTAGDEALMFARDFPDVPLAVGRRKAMVAARLARAFSLDCLIVDDGFQHLRLARDLDIVLLDARAPFGNGRVLPAGPLREPPDALRDAHIILLTHADRAQDISAVREMVAAHAPGVPLVEANHRPLRLRVGGTTETAPLTSLRGRELLAVCGVASPGAFADMLRELGATVRLRAFPDHHPYTGRDFEAIRRDAGPLPVVTTAKDEVKWLRRANFAYWTLDVRMVWRCDENTGDRRQGTGDGLLTPVFAVLSSPRRT
jgi:tetraacyldisaccharide 4'-kinase